MTTRHLIVADVDGSDGGRRALDWCTVGPVDLGRRPSGTVPADRRATSVEVMEEDVMSPRLRPATSGRHAHDESLRLVDRLHQILAKYPTP